MSQEILNGLTVLCIEKYMLKNINVILLSMISHLEILEDSVFYEHLYA